MMQSWVGLSTTLLACWLIALSSPRVSADTGNWFTLSDEAGKDWLTMPLPGPVPAFEIEARGSSGDAGQRVTVFFSQSSPAYDIAMNEILSVFSEKGIAVRWLLLNYAADPDLGKLAIEKAQQEKSNLLFAMGSDVVAFMLDVYRHGTIPVVTVCAKDPVILQQIGDYDQGSGSHFAFTSLNMPIAVQFAYLRELVPSLQNMGILVDATNVSAVRTQANPLAKIALDGGIHVIDLALLRLRPAAEELAERIPGVVDEMRKTDPTGIHSLFVVTGSTAVFREMFVINQYAGSIPVVSMIPEIVTTRDDSAALSIGVSFRSNAHLAALYGAEILTGKRRAGDLPVGLVYPPDVAINFLKARHSRLKVPFSFFEAASDIIDYQGRFVRKNGLAIHDFNRSGP